MSAANYMKNKWVDILINSIITGLMVVLAFWLNTSDMDARALDEKIEQKVDKKEFTNYKSDHQLIHDRDREDLKEMSRKIDEIYKYLLNKKD